MKKKDALIACMKTYATGRSSKANCNNPKKAAGEVMALINLLHDTHIEENHECYIHLKCSLRACSLIAGTTIRPTTYAETAQKLYHNWPKIGNYKFPFQALVYLGLMDQ